MKRPRDKVLRRQKERAKDSVDNRAPENAQDKRAGSEEMCQRKPVGDEDRLSAHKRPNSCEHRASRGDPVRLKKKGVCKSDKVECDKEEDDSGKDLFNFVSHFL